MGSLHDALGDRHGLHGLAGHLAQALAGDKAARAACARPPCSEMRIMNRRMASGEQRLRAVAAQFLLHLGEGNDVNGEPTGTTG